MDLKLEGLVKVGCVDTDIVFLAPLAEPPAQDERIGGPRAHGCADANPTQRTLGGLMPQ